MFFHPRSRAASNSSRSSCSSSSPIFCRTPLLPRLPSDPRNASSPSSNSSLYSSPSLSRFGTGGIGFHRWSPLSEASTNSWEAAANSNSSSHSSFSCKVPLTPELPKRIDARCHQPFAASFLGLELQEEEEKSSPAVPFEIVQQLLMGNLDPIQFARENLAPKDFATVVRRHTNPAFPKVDLKCHHIYTKDDVLFVGLSYAGFEKHRQTVRDKLNNERFHAFYKLCPEAVLDAKKYFDNYGEAVITFERLLYTLNFLKLYDTEMVLSGRWKLCEDSLRDNIWKTLRRVQAHKDELIYIDPNEFNSEEVHIMTVDTVNYKIEEPRTDKDNCGKKWYDQKSSSAGVKYEFALPLTLRRQTCIWSNGPYPAGDKGVAHDGCLFRGGYISQDKSTWDKSSLYFHIPSGKKAIGDGLYGGMPEKCSVSIDGHEELTKRMINRAKAMQETYHGKMQDFNVLKYRFRHGSTVKKKMSMHKSCVESIHIFLHFDLKHRPILDW